MDLSGFESFEQSGIASRRTGSGDPVVRGPLREVQHLGAVDEHRGAGFLEVELARIHLGQMSEKPDLELPLLGDEPP